MATLPPWFKALVWSEVLVQLPFFFWAAAAFARGDARVVRPAAGRPLLHPPLQRLHLVDLGEAEILAIHERPDRPDELPAEVRVAAAGPCPKGPSGQRGEASEGGEVVNQTVAAMKSIADKIGIIDCRNSLTESKLL